MNASAKIKELFLVSGIILTFVIGIVILSSQRDLSVTNSQASSDGIPTVTATPTPSPTTAQNDTQDVPLKVLGVGQSIPVGVSYLYTELASKGIISNISANSATIVWLTEAPQQMTLYYGTKSNQLIRKISETAPRYIHNIELPNLAPNYTYYYTGHAPITDSFTTPGSISSGTAAQTIQGVFTQNYGECLIRATLTREDLVSSYATTTTKTVNWSISLRNLRTADLSRYFTPQTSDTVEIDSFCMKSQSTKYSGIIRTTVANSKANILSVTLPLID